MPSGQSGLSTRTHPARSARARTSSAAAPSTTYTVRQPPSRSDPDRVLDERAAAVREQRLGPAAEPPAAARREQQSAVTCAVICHWLRHAPHIYLTLLSNSVPAVAHDTPHGVNWPAHPGS